MKCLAFNKFTYLLVYNAVNNIVNFGTKIVTYIF